MDLILIILGGVGLAAILISAYVFTVAARLYVSDEESQQTGAVKPRKTHDNWVTRRPGDRRKGGPVAFPLVVNGEIITSDRRIHPERRSHQPPAPGLSKASMR